MREQVEVKFGFNSVVESNQRDPGVQKRKNEDHGVKGQMKFDFDSVVETNQRDPGE